MIQYDHFVNIQSCELLLFNLLTEMKIFKISVDEFAFTKILQFKFIEWVVYISFDWSFLQNVECPKPYPQVIWDSMFDA